MVWDIVMGVSSSRDLKVSYPLTRERGARFSLFFHCALEGALNTAALGKPDAPLNADEDGAVVIA
jgi:hypothetical protein